MNLFNRMMPADYAYKLLSGKNYVFLYANPKTKEGLEKRGTRVKEDISPVSYYEIEYFSTGTSQESKIEEGFRIKGVDGLSKEYLSLRKRDMYLFIEHLFSLSKNLVVDFTLMNTRFLGSFCALLNLFQWEEVYFCYTEPGNYKKNEQDKYDLKNTTMGFDQIPNLETFSDSSTECDWVVFLGFEGSRLMRLEEESPSSRRFSLPYISIPAMKTNWHNVALDENSQFFELKISNQEKLDYVSAINPFETYDKLTYLKHNNANVRLVVSPIGPKPVMLGCVMYVLENEDEMLLFDNPFQEGNNTEDYGASHFYDLSQFVRSVKNKRFY